MHQIYWLVDRFLTSNSRARPVWLCVKCHSFTWLRLLVGSKNNQTNEMVYCEKYSGYSDAQNWRQCLKNVGNLVLYTCLWDLKMASATHCPRPTNAVMKWPGRKTGWWKGALCLWQIQAVVVTADLHIQSD